ncbi:hypothetical protein ACA910_015126 [Epithemia clementina (nom. ined.)]
MTPTPTTTAEAEGQAGKQQRQDEGVAAALIASQAAIESLSEDVEYLWCQSSSSSIPIYHEPPSALDFFRNHVSVSRPCIIRNAILCPDENHNNDGDDNDDDVGATTTTTSSSSHPLQLTLDDLLEQTPNLMLYVDVTPDGHGDCLRKTTTTTTTEASSTARSQLEEQEEQNAALDNSSTSSRNHVETTTTQDVFVKPMQVQMSLSTFAKHLRNGRTKAAADKSSPAIIQERIFPVAPTTSRSQDENMTNRVVEDDDDDDDNNDILDRSVLYYSRQNDCLRQELTPLWNLWTAKEKTGQSTVVPESFAWAQEAFFGAAAAAVSSEQPQQQPDAVNLWMGDERAVSAMHKDHYENLFYVLSGEKVFCLCPPADAPFLYEQPVASGQFCHGPQRRCRPKDSKDPTQNNNNNNNNKLDLTQPGQSKEQSSDCYDDEWAVQIDQGDQSDETSFEHQPAAPQYVHWIAANVCHPDAESDNKNKFPLSKYAHPIRNVKVQAGELLYLPSLWFHQVTQSCETIGINYWYDMKFESPLWCYFHFLQQLQPHHQ